MKNTLITLIATLFCITAFAESVTSPDGRLTFTFEQANGLFYSVSRDGKAIIDRSPMGVAIENKLFESALAVPNEAPEHRGKGWCTNLQFVEAQQKTVDETWTPPYGEWNKIRNHYNELTLCFKKGEEERVEKGVNGTDYVKSKCYFFNIKVRAYNEGIAFCYEFPETSNGLFLHLTDELTEFRLADNGANVDKAWMSEWAQGPFIISDLSKSFDGEVERPLTIRQKDGSAVAILEARCVDYVRTKLMVKGNGVLKAQPYSSCDVMTPFSTSWRVIMVADNMIDLCNHDYMVLNLNDASDNDDYTWIKPGKVFRSDLNKEALFKAVDFAAARHFQYIHLDSGWYGRESSMESSALTIGEGRDFTIKEVVDYASTKGIGVILYINQRALYKELDSICAQLEAWGVRGIKFGFVQVGNQKWTSWLHDAVKTCARHHLMVDIHDEYRPTGYSRTYPNLMSAEGIRGNEEMPDASHNVTLPFTRYLCGPADYTLCYFNNRVQGTRAHQLAMAAVYYSPLTWMFWYDKPHFYNGENELEFWENIPTVWDDTRVLQGEAGEYIVTARRSGHEWYVGAMNGTTARTVTLPLTMLEKGKKYTAYLYEDDPANVPNNRLAKGQKPVVNCKTMAVTAKTVLTLPLVASGGAAIRIVETVAPAKEFAAEQLAYCHEQVSRALTHLGANGQIDFTQHPRNILTQPQNLKTSKPQNLTTSPYWNCRRTCAEEWCSGFWPGVLWMDYTASKNNEVAEAAKGYTEVLEPLSKGPAYDHDLGFITINSYIKGYEATHNEAYRKVIIDAANTLSTLYNPTVGTILSWPRHVKDYGGHNTIMDNLINLELLLWAADNGGDSRLRDIAIRHAETTMHNHFQPDGTGYHVAVYDTISGRLIKGMTHQGYADNTMWSRGQSWAIYGYTTMYRYTHDRRFLDFAQKVTDIYLKRLSETSDDWVPLWDMDAPYDPVKDAANPMRLGGVPKDASAACVVASALLDLSKYVKGSKAKEYRHAAEMMLRDLSTDKYQSRHRNVAFLMHSTGHHPAGSEIDASIVYADYYYIEALTRLYH